MENNECRICFEGNNLLTDICLCKGSQAYIHNDCLRKVIYFTKTIICNTCKAPYKLDSLNPKLWNYLGSPGFEFLIRITYLTLYYYNQNLLLEFSYYNNLVLIGLYLYAYSQLIPSLTLKDFFLWLQPYIIYNQNYYFPLFNLFYIIFTYYSPILLMIYFPYPRLYEIQKVIGNIYL